MRVLTSPFQLILLVFTICSWCELVHGGKEHRIKKGTTNAKRDAGFPRQSEQQYKRLVQKNREFLSDKLRLDSTTRSDRKLKSCSDCKRGKENPSLPQTHRPYQSTLKLPKVSVRVRVSRKKISHSEHWRPKSVDSIVTGNKFTSLLERRARKLGNDRKRLHKKLLLSENQNGVHEVDIDKKFDVENIKEDQSKVGYENVGKEKSILLKTVGLKTSKGLHDPKTHLYQSETKAYSRVKSGKRQIFGPSEAMARDEGLGNLSGGSSAWSADTTGGTFNGNKLVRPWQADRLENSGTSLLANIQKLRTQTYKMIKTFIAADQQLGTYHRVIINGTLKTILPGVREATEEIHEANEYILNGMKTAYQVRARESLRGQLRARGMSSSYRDDNRQKAVATVSEIESRNFYDKLEQAETQEDEMQLFATSVYLLQSSYIQEKSEMERLQKLFDKQDYFIKLRSLRDYLNNVIRTINTNFLNRPALRKLRLFKRLLDYTHNVLRNGRNLIAQSDKVVASAMLNLKKKRQLLEKWLVKQRSVESDSVKPRSMTSMHTPEMSPLATAVAASTAHSQNLTKTADRSFRDLLSSTNEAKKFMLQLPGGVASNIKLQSQAKMLEDFIPEMYAALGEIGNLTSSSVHIRRPAKCIPGETFEGSGDVGEIDRPDEEVFLCDDESDGKPKAPSSSDKSDEDDPLGFFTWFTGGNTENDDDFSFEESEPTVISAEHRVTLIKEGKQDISIFNQDVKAYSTTLLGRSQEVFESAKPLNGSLKSLQENWRDLQEDVNTIEKTIGAHKALKKELEEMAKDTMSVTSRIEHLGNLPSLLQLNNVIRTAKRIERKYVAVATGNKEPNAGWQDDYYGFDYYNADYYYDNNEESKKDSFEKVLEQRDAAVANYENLYTKGQQIQDNHQDIIQRLHGLSETSCDRVSNQLVSVNSNLTILRQKVMQARTMLSSMQLSISKRGETHFAFPVNHSPDRNNEEQTSVRLCIKPTSLDGPVVVVQGNESASFTLSLDGGVLTAAMYDANWNNLNEITMEKVLEKDTWYTLQIQRLGLYLNVSVQQNGKDSEVKSMQVNLGTLQSIKSTPAMVFVGGVPANIDVLSGSWDGCFGNVAINDHSLSIFTLDSDGQRPSICDSYCSPRNDQVSAIFDGDGFIHYNKLIRGNIVSITFTFTSHQQTAALMSIVNRTEGFSLNVVLENGSLKVQRSSEQKSAVYLSSDKGYGDGKPHEVKFEMKDSTTHITVNEKRDQFNVNSSKPDDQTRFLDGISIGAFVSSDRRFQPNMPRPLIGCISNISVNDERLTLSEAQEIYNVYHGKCSDVQHQFWHTCYQWSNDSSSLVLEDLPDSKAISLWVSYDATGPLLSYVKEDEFTIDIALVEEGLAVTYSSSSQILKKEQHFETNGFFSVKVVDITDEACVQVFAWAQVVETCYGGNWFWSSSDSKTPHTLTLGGLGQNTDTEQHENFAGSISQLMVENRLIDLSQFKESNKIEACQRPLTKIQTRTVKTTPTPTYKSFSCSKPEVN